MDFLPIFLNIRDKNCLVVGGGMTATRRAELLLQAQAKVHIVSPNLSNKLQICLEQQKLTYRKGSFEITDLQQKCLIIAATNDKQVNAEISKQAHDYNIPVNVVDQPELCSFIVPSIIDRHPVQIAISTGGASPVLARLLRAKLESVIPSAYGRLAEFMAQFRDKVKKSLSFEQRRGFWENVLQGSIAEMLLSGHTHEAHEELERLLKDKDNIQKFGEVYLVGGGPGDPDLLTFRALRLMQQADVVLYDRLISSAVLDLVRRDAERIYVGKQTHNHSVPQEEINQLLADLAKQGKRVLRLKGGDPFMFGRGGEEIETLMEQGVPFQVVPGITAALGMSSYAGIPLTHRDYAQSCIFVTGHLKDDSVDLNWSMLAHENQTLVIYMGLRTLPIICEKLIEHGLPKHKPAALVQKATTSDQVVVVGTLETLAEKVAAAGITKQSLIVVGDVVNLHEKLHWFDSTTGVKLTDSII
ncbi:MAG: siroheme synthase CysG [Thiotrichaceae bacterium]|nr:siroheme synthase CysG [Thiotrichaceae bacterium]